MIHLVDVGIRAAPLDWFPQDWPYWIRDTEGNIFREVSHDEHAILQPWGLMDFTHPHIQDRIVQQAIAVDKCGLYDGIFFDFWSDEWPVLAGWDGKSIQYFRTLDAERLARANIIRRIRAATRPTFLTMRNTNHVTIPLTAPYVNAGFMEVGVPYDNTGAELENALNQVENTLLWFADNLREPRIHALEGTSIPSEPPDSPNNIRWMRTITSLIVLALCSLDGLAQEYTQWHLPEGAKLRLGKGEIYEIEYSPDGSRLAVASSTGIWLYNTVNFKEATLFADQIQEVRTIAYAADGSVLVSGSYRGRGSATVGCRNR